MSAGDKRDPWGDPPTLGDVLMHVSASLGTEIRILEGVDHRSRLEWTRRARELLHEHYNSLSREVLDAREAEAEAGRWLRPEERGETPEHYTLGTDRD